jgi:hypothetical protein
MGGSKLTLSSSSEDDRTNMAGITTAVAEGDELLFVLETLTSGTPAAMVAQAFIRGN